MLMHARKTGWEYVLFMVREREDSQEIGADCPQPACDQQPGRPPSALSVKSCRNDLLHMAPPPP